MYIFSFVSVPGNVLSEKSYCIFLVLLSATKEHVIMRRWKAFILMLILVLSFNPKVGF